MIHPERYSATQYVKDISEIEALPAGADTPDDELPERLRYPAWRMREARKKTYPPLSSEQLATVASRLGMRLRIKP